MFISSQSMYQGLFFSILSYLVAIPSAIKIFNWTATIYKGNVRWDSPFMFALSFMGLFTIGGLTGLYLSNMGTDVHLTNTYFVVAHFHYTMVGGALSAFLGALHYWWPKMFGRMYTESWAKICAILVFVGFNLTFLPQFIAGWVGMPRRYHYYYFIPEVQFYNICSTLGATVLAVGVMLPAFYLTWSLKYGKLAPANPWGSHGLEWDIPSPPTTFNFEQTPVVRDDVYDYDNHPDTVRGLEGYEHLVKEEVH